MHTFTNINLKKLIIVNLVFFLFSSFVSLYSEECQNFDTKLKEAKEYFPIFNEIVLNYSLRDAFIKNYNTGTVWGPPLWIPYSSMLIGAILMTMSYISELILHVRKLKEFE